MVTLQALAQGKVPEHWLQLPQLLHWGSLFRPEAENVQYEVTEVAAAAPQREDPEAAFA